MRAKSKEKWETQQKGAISRKKEWRLCEWDTTEQETDGQIDASVVCITE